MIEDAHQEGHVVAFNEASDTLASGGIRRIRLWGLPGGKPRAEWKAHTGAIHGLAFVNNDTGLLSASGDGSLAMWTLNGDLLSRRQTAAPVTDMAADTRFGMIVTGHTDGHVRAWSLPDLTPEFDEGRHRGKVRAVAFHAGTGLFASSGADGRVFVWRRGQAARELRSPPTDAVDLAFSPDGDRLTGGGWFRLFQWALPEGALTVLPTAHFGAIKSLQYLASGRTLATIGSGTDSSVYFLDAETGAVTARFQPHDLCGAYIRLSPDGRYLATTSDDASIRIWDLRHFRDVPR